MTCTNNVWFQSRIKIWFFQAKTAFEADIDCVQEIADFYRFGIHYAKVKTSIRNTKNTKRFYDHHQISHMSFYSLHYILFPWISP